MGMEKLGTIANRKADGTLFKAKPKKVKIRKANY
jgi:hypothetical protein